MKNVGNSSDGRSQEVPKVSRHPCIGRMGALRGHLCDSTAFLFGSSNRLHAAEMSAWILTQCQTTRFCASKCLLRVITAKFYIQLNFGENSKNTIVSMGKSSDIGVGS